MATIETKYSVGDTVYWASTISDKKRHDCPDCLGERKWKATSPAGTDYDFGCPRCSNTYISERDLSLEYSAFIPCVRKLTIGSIRLDTKPFSGDCQVQYMCLETGVGGGQIYNETDLFESEDVALVAAEAKAAATNVGTEWIVKLYDRSLKLSDYQMNNAVLEMAKEERLKARSMIWNIEDLFGSIKEADDKDAILELVDDYQRYSGERDKARADVDSITA